jgi:site-specific DNA recombinase
MSNRNQHHDNLLAGLLYDGLGRRMQGSQANRGATRYHYYVTNPSDKVSTPGQSWRLPAVELEATVLQRLRMFLTNPASLYDAAAAARLPNHLIGALVENAAACMGEMASTAKSGIKLVRRVDAHDDRLVLTLCIDALLPAQFSSDEPSLNMLTVPMCRRRRGKDVRIVTADEANAVRTAADPALVKLIAIARTAWSAMLTAGDQPLATVAKAQGYSLNYFTLLLRLATLSPCIVQAIVNGRQPVTLTRQRLATIKNLPIDWIGQRAMLGFQ